MTFLDFKVCLAVLMSHNFWSLLIRNESKFFIISNSGGLLSQCSVDCALISLVGIECYLSRPSDPHRFYDPRPVR
jgi:hypothetical protein